MKPLSKKSPIKKLTITVAYVSNPSRVYTLTVSKTSVEGENPLKQEEITNLHNDLVNFLNTANL